MYCGEESKLRDIDTVERCLEGDEVSIRKLEGVIKPNLRAALCASGATLDEAEDIVSALWVECLAGSAEKPPLFHRYNGKSSVNTWLNVIAINRWISLKRHHVVHARAMEALSAQEPRSLPPEGIAAADDDELLKLLEGAIRDAFNACSPEELVLFRLTHFHELTQRELARLWGWQESKLSRQLKKTASDIAERTMTSLKESDPYLQLTWSDLIKLCDSVCLVRG